MKNGIIFDMDGVLIDSAPHHFESWKLLAAENGLEAHEDFFWETFGRTNSYIIPRFFGRDMAAREIQRHAERKEALYRELIADKAEPLPGLLTFIEGMVALGWSVGIGSSGPRANVEQIMDAFGLTKTVAAFTSAEDVTLGKPDPEVFLKAAAKLELEPTHCVVVEDAVHGVHAARAAGMRCIAITTTNPREALHEADLVIDSFQEIMPQQAVDLLAGV